MAKKPATKAPKDTSTTKLEEPKPSAAVDKVKAKTGDAAEKVTPKEDKNSSSGGKIGLTALGLGLLLCGVAAGALLGPRFAPQYFGTDTSAIENRLSELESTTSARITALETVEAPNFTGQIDQAVAALSNEVQGNLQELETKIAATDGSEIEARLAEAETALAGLRAAFESMIEDLNAANATGTDAQIDTTLAEIAALQSQIEELSAMNGALSQKIDEIDIAATKTIEEAAEAQAEAAAVTNAAERNRLIGNLDAAMQRGEPLAPYLTALEELGVGIPQGLNTAEAGIARLSDLEEGFSSAAHAALRADAANATDAGGVGSQIQSFFQSQISIRSLDAKEGTSTDAILSRMEQALEVGDLNLVVSEAAALSEPAQNAMGGWLDQARARLGAFEALYILKQGG